jgi:Protein of unknown function (DUF3575)
MKSNPLKKLIFYFIFFGHYTEICSQPSIKSHAFSLGTDISAIHLDFKADILYGASANYEKAFAKKWSLGLKSKYLRYKIKRGCQTIRTCVNDFNKSMISSQLQLNFYTKSMFEGFNLGIEIGHSKIWENYVNWNSNFLPLRALFKTHFLSTGLTMGYNINLKTNWLLGFKGSSTLFLSKYENPAATSLSCQIGVKF